jgi:hypothetical protein
MKERLKQIQLANEDQFCECLQEILRDVDQAELNGVFQAWVRQLQEVSQGKARQGRARQGKAMETMSDDKSFSSKVGRSIATHGFITPRII